MRPVFPPVASCSDLITRELAEEKTEKRSIFSNNTGMDKSYEDTVAEPM